MMLFKLPLFALVATCFALETRQNTPPHAKCRFSPDASQEQILKDATSFEDSIFYWDGQFHQDGVGYQKSNGITIDHIFLGYTTGMPGSTPTLRSNPKNEAYHIMLLTHAIAGNNLAAVFLDPLNTTGAAEVAFSILSTKLKTYIAFNQTYPGFGGFLPTFMSNNTHIWPAEGWNDRVSAIDNGHLIWATYALIQVLNSSPNTELQHLAFSWATYFLYLRANARGMFYHGGIPGSVCAVPRCNSGIPAHDALQTYNCDESSGFVNSPYQGELMAWFLYFSGTLNSTEGQTLWDAKRPQLQAVNFTGSIVSSSHTQSGSQNYTGDPIVGKHITPITTQKGRYFGAQEHVKLLFLPYLDIPIVNRVMRNAERIRTCNSALMDKTPGMFAAVTNATSATITNEQEAIVAGYIESAGIPSVSFIQTQEQDILTPYASFATILFDKGIGLAWYKNMLDAKCMQSIHGSVAGIRRDGSQVSRFVSWETKAPTLLALLGGIVDFVGDGLKRDGVLAEFVRVTDREYGLVFDENRNGGRPLMGEKVEFCLPVGKISGLGLNDYSSCRLRE